MVPYFNCHNHKCELPYGKCEPPYGKCEPPYGKCEILKKFYNAIVI